MHLDVRQTLPMRRPLRRTSGGARQPRRYRDSTTWYLIAPELQQFQDGHQPASWLAGLSGECWMLDLLPGPGAGVEPTPAPARVRQFQHPVLSTQRPALSAEWGAGRASHAALRPSWGWRTTRSGRAPSRRDGARRAGGTRSAGRATATRALQAPPAERALGAGAESRRTMVEEAGIRPDRNEAEPRGHRRDPLAR